MRKEIKQGLILSLGTLCLSLLVLEAILRVFVSPSQFSYGTLFGKELPPVKVIPCKTPPPPTDHSAWSDHLIIDGHKITLGDLWGFFREDNLLGYTTKENMISVNGWWQSNNLGARARYDIAEIKSEGRKRMLVFGDSFAVGSRVRQEEMWSAILEATSHNLEVLNFGVDGYSMGQSFLRYREIRNRVDHDLVLLMFVPSADLMRDINTVRSLIGWENYLVMPRFILEQGELRLVKSPYEVASSVYVKNGEMLSEELRSHLIAYDRFYFRSELEEPRFIGKSILYKLAALAYYKYQIHSLKDWLVELEPDSEALQVSKKIFETINHEVKQDGKKFILVFLPVERDVKLLKRNTTYHNNWKNMVLSTCTHDLICIDLADDLRQLPENQFDAGYDGSHYGPKINKLIGEWIGKQLELKNILTR
jgi:hypothetical protein